MVDEEGERIYKVRYNEAIKLMGLQILRDIVTWSKVNKRTSELCVNEPNCCNAEKFYHVLRMAYILVNFMISQQKYYQSLNLIINCIEDRFKQPGYEVYHSLETLLFKACKQKVFENDVQIVCQFDKGDFDNNLLSTQLSDLWHAFSASTRLSSGRGQH